MLDEGIAKDSLFGEEHQGAGSVGHPARVRRVSALQGMAVDSPCPSAGRQEASRVKTQWGTDTNFSLIG